jgi:RND family efflux transporter MFP subunit
MLLGVYFEIGDEVKKGQILAKVDDTIPKLAMQEAEAAYESSKIALEAAEKLFAGGNSSRAELSQRKSLYSGALSRYESALKIYNDCTIKSPIDGWVAYKNPELSYGNYIAPGFRAAKIVDISSLKMRIGIGEMEIPLIKKGDKAFVTVPASCNPGPFEGRVEATAAGSELKSGTFEVLVSWENPCINTVKSGMSASVKINTDTNEKVLVIPSIALTEKGGVKGVFVVNSNRASFVPVLTGRVTASKVEIKEGLKEGNEILISALKSLESGSNVITKNLGPTSGWE